MKIDFKKLKESLKMSQKLKAMGLQKKQYNLASPYEKRKSLIVDMVR